MIILGIETSCDETSASILKIKEKNNILNIKIISNIISSQIPIHRKYGGVVPEVAARAHIEKIIPVIKTAIRKTKKIDLIAVTNGPGLATSLMVGTETAKTISYINKIPLIGINHLKAHIAANFININDKKIFPAMCLIVSGGHTELVLAKNHTQYKKIGQTRDDAAGECFDKVAKLLNLGYPGGPEISKHAEQYKNINIKLPRPMIDSNNFDFSFSGLKTAVMYLIKKNRNKLSNKNFIANVCAETQQAIIDVLIKKTIQSAKIFNPKSIILCGGVAANKELRKQFREKINDLKINFFVPPINLCTDNAAMIGACAYFEFKKRNALQKNNLKNNWQRVKIDPNLQI